jgi:glycosyltransferase involved in cell wall biosynthesis
MNFLFLLKYTNLLAGTPTLAARMSRWLVSNGHSVTVLGNRMDESCIDLFDRRVDIINHDHGEYELGCIRKANNILSEFNILRPDVIKSFDPISWWEASVVSQCFSPPSKVIAGVYLPKPVSVTSKFFRNTRLKIVLRQFERHMGRDNRLFISDQQLENYRLVKYSFMNGHIWPLAIDVERFVNVDRQPRKGAIVSIGRISSMKEYNFYMVDVVEQLLRDGYDLTWDVYGDGVDKERLAQLIKDRNLQDHIHLHGRLPYTQFENALKNAYFFVGMGTAALEAAACGVPTIVAIESDKTGMTYGRISQLPFGNIGDRMRQPPNLFVKDEIRAILECSPEQYSQEAEHDRTYVKQYSMEQRMRHFMEIVERARPFSPDKFFMAAYSAHLKVEKFRVCLSRKNGAI